MDDLSDRFTIYLVIQQNITIRSYIRRKSRLTKQVFINKALDTFVRLYLSHKHRKKMFYYIKKTKLDQFRFAVLKFKML